MASVDANDQNVISYEISGTLTAADDSSSESGDESASESSNQVGDASDEELEVFSSGVSNTSFAGSRSRAPAQVSSVKEVRTEKGKDAAVSIPSSLAPLSFPPTIHDAHHSSQNAESVHVAENDEDDEFGWDEDTRDTSSLVELLSREKQVDQPIDFTDDLQRFQEALAIASTTGDEEEPAESYKKGAVIDKLRSESAQALQDVVSVYGDGLGDQSIFIDENITKNKFDDAGDALKTGVLSAIVEEEDEDDQDDDDDDVPTANRGKPIAKEISIAIDETTHFGQEFQHLENFGTNEHVAVSVDGATKTPSTFVVLSSEDILSYLSMSNLSIYESRIRIREESKSWFTGIMSTKLRYDDCENELKRPFLFAEVDYDPYNDTHLNLLRTIYSFFLPESNLQPFDSRWERIGFQGGDPRTDLNRSMKMLTLILTRKMQEKEPNLAHSLFTMSKCSLLEFASKADIESSWPFACVAIMFTKESLAALRRGALYPLCNKLSSSLEAIYAFFEACFIEFGKLLLKYPTTHHALHLATIRKRCEGDGSRILKHTLERSMVRKIIDQSQVDLLFTNLEEGDADGDDGPGEQSSLPLGGRAQRFVADT